MSQGDDFAKKFGGESGDEPDWLRLTIEGFSGDQQSIGSVDFYLADYRFSDNDLDYLVDQWTEVSLESISQAVELQFSLSSSDVGEFGMNTPAYFAVDNVSLVGGQEVPTVTLARNSFDTSTDLQVQLTSSDTSELRVPAQVLIPAGSAAVTVPIEILNDRLVDGTQVVQLTASADSFGTATINASVLDIDDPQLAVTFLASEVDESGESVTAIVHRNSADLTSPLEVSLVTEPGGQLQFPSQVSIPIGLRSISVTLTTIDNLMLDGDRTVSVEASALGHAVSSNSITVVDDELGLRIEIDRDVISEADASATGSLEDRGAILPPNSFYNGADSLGGFVSGPVAFNNAYDPTFGSWAGWSVSNMTDPTTPGFVNQYSSVVGQGALGSATYAVANAFPGDLIPTITIEDAFSASSFESIMVTNTTYAARSMENGDGFAKRFGGESGDDPDFLLLSIEGINTLGESVGQVDFYLADFRFDDNRMDYVVDQWTKIDLTALAGATKLSFMLSSSDVGAFGINTPAYFALDQVVLSDPDRNPILASVHRSTRDVSEPLVVQLASSDESEARVRSTVTIPAGAGSVAFEIGSVDDAVVDGTQWLNVTASSVGYFSSLVSISVEDDEQAGLRILQSDGSTFFSELRGEDDLLVTLSARPLSDVVVSISSSSSDFQWSSSRLTFTPDDWNQPQVVIVSGIPDLHIEGDETQELFFETVPIESDDRFVEVEPIGIDVVVLDQNPTELRVGEDVLEVFLVDEATGVRILSYPLENGIHVVGNEDSQLIQIDDLRQTAGLVRVEADRGDDTVMLRGGYFSLVDGGVGFDSLILNLEEAIEFAAFLDQRAIGFEEYVLASDSGASLRINGVGLDSVASQDGQIVLRVRANQTLEFSQEAVLVEPRMHGGEFAQVVELGESQVVVITVTPWQNIQNPLDVNGNGEVTALDALAVINELAWREQPELPSIQTLNDFAGQYVDVTADGMITAMDALRVINEMTRRNRGVEFEQLAGAVAVASSSMFTEGSRQSEASVDDEVPRGPVLSRVSPSFFPLQVQVLQQDHEDQIAEDTSRIEEANIETIDRVLSLLTDS